MFCNVTMNEVMLFTRCKNDVRTGEFFSHSQMCHFGQGCSKVFTIGQARINPEHYVINARVADNLSNAHMAFLSLTVLCDVLSLSNLQITLALCLLLNFCTVCCMKYFCVCGQPINDFPSHHNLFLSAIS